MGRRKRMELDDGDSDSTGLSDLGGGDADWDNDPDAREERALFEDPYRHKRRRKNGKDDAVYGVFGDDSDENDGYDKRKGGASRKKADWTKAPAFVSGNKDENKKVDLEHDMEVEYEEKMTDGDVAMRDSDEDVEEESAEDGEDGSAEDEEQEPDSSDNDSEPSRPPSPRVRVPEEDEDESLRPRIGGIGSSKSTDTTTTATFSAFTKGGIGSGKAGIGSGKAGLGAAAFTAATFAAATTTSVSTINDTPPSELPKAGIGSRRGGIGSSTNGAPSSSKAGIGSSQPPETPLSGSASGTSTPSYPPSADLPAAFGGGTANRSRAFVRDTTPGGSNSKPYKLNGKEQVHFAKIQGSFGARMLAKMGWQVGTGLGVEGEGIITPIESKLRPQKMGIAFKGFKEKTEQSKMEARRKGEIVSDDEEDPQVRKFKKKQREAEEKKREVWKKPKKVKVKVEHKTYEQIIAEAGQETQVVTGLGQIIDARGAVPREVSSLTEVSLNDWAPTADATRIPEVRHNVRLIADACKQDLAGLAREGKALDEHKKHIVREDARLRKKVEDEAELIARLQKIQLVTKDLSMKSKEVASVYEVSLEPFTPLIYALVNEYEREFDQYGLDEIVVAAIAPTVRRMVATWDPLDNPTLLIETFRGWRKALKVNKVEEQKTDGLIIPYGAMHEPSAIIAEPDMKMTPFESLLWNIWLPKVRTAINNDWSAFDPQPAIKLYEGWSTYLPPFIRDNIMDQLILPKVQKAVSDWSPRKHVSLRSVVFPWMPHVGLRLQGLMDDARRKIKSVLRNWNVGDDVPQDLASWKDVFDVAEWDNMLLKYIVPKLGATLRKDLRINPRDQKLEPLLETFKWSPLIRPSVFSQLLEAEFFPKWLDILHIWLIQPTASLTQVSEWYQFWRNTLREGLGGDQVLATVPAVEKGFTRGLQLMNNAIELGEEGRARLPKPDYKAEVAAAHARANAPKVPKLPTTVAPQEVTFRSIVEDYTATHNLLFIPAGKVHERSRMPLFRVSPSADGRGGLLIYVLDDAVWAAKNGGVGGEAEEYHAIGLEEMVLRAKKTRT